jgi:hypothetical protein
MRTVDAVIVRGRSGDGGLSRIGEAAGEFSDGKAGDFLSGLRVGAFEAMTVDLRQQSNFDFTLISLTLENAF